MTREQATKCAKKFASKSNKPAAIYYRPSNGQWYPWHKAKKFHDQGITHWEVIQPEKEMAVQ